MTKQPKRSTLKRFLLSLSSELLEVIDELRGDQERCAFVESLLLEHPDVLKLLKKRYGKLPVRNVRGGYPRKQAHGGEADGC